MKISYQVRYAELVDVKPVSFPELGAFHILAAYNRYALLNKREYLEVDLDMWGACVSHYRSCYPVFLFEAMLSREFIEGIIDHQPVKGEINNLVKTLRRIAKTVTLSGDSCVVLKLEWVSRDFYREACILIMPLKASNRVKSNSSCESEQGDEK